MSIVVKNNMKYVKEVIHKSDDPLFILPIILVNGNSKCSRISSKTLQISCSMYVNLTIY